MAIGQNPRKYLGVEAPNPPNVWKADRAPTSSDDDARYRIGDVWVDETNDVAYQYVGPGNWDSSTVVAASTTVAGVIEIATDAEALAKSETDKALVPSNLAASGFLQWADVTLTSAEIKALRATPIEVVAAPAAGSIHMFMGAQLKLNYGGSNVFTETDDNLAIKYTDGSGVAVSQTIQTTGFIDQSADTITNAAPAVDAIVAAASGEAQALVIHNTGDGEIAGNAANDNTVTLRVYYVTHAL